MTVSRARAIRATAEELWEVLSDPHRLPAWWPGVQRVEEVLDGAWTKVLRAPKAGKAVRADYSVVDSEPPSRLIWRHEVEESPFERLMSESLYEFELIPALDSTRVSLTARMRLRGFSRLGGFQVRRATRRRLDQALAGLAALVERVEPD
jgi:uncharacterized protein YndB with AHSA1/START domain